MKKIPVLSIGLMLLAGWTAKAAVIAQWDFAPGSFLVDSVGGNNFIQTGAGVMQGTGPGGVGTYSAHFDGTGYLSTASSLDLSPYRQLSISWSSRSASSFGVLLSHGWSGPNSFIVDNNETGADTGFVGIFGTGYKLESFTQQEDVWADYIMEINLDGATIADQLKIFKNGLNVGTVFLDQGSSPTAFLNTTFFTGAVDATGAFKFVGDIANLTISGTAIPEPGTLALLGLGLPLLVCYARRKRA